MANPSQEILCQINNLQLEADRLRREAKVSLPGECLWRSDMNGVDDFAIVVIADGLGGADCQMVSGNWPVACRVERSRFFPTENEANNFASEVHEHQDWDYVSSGWGILEEFKYAESQG